MSSPRVLSLATAEPERTFSQDEAIDALDNWLEEKDPEELPFSRQDARRIFRNAGVERRHSVRPLEDFLTPTDFGEKTERFLEEAPALGLRAIRRALNRADLSPGDVDLLMTVSCTGFSIPSLDAYIMNELDFRSDTRRLPVAQLGCAAGVSGISRAYDYLKAYPDSTVLLLSVELCTLNLQPDDLSRTQIVSSAIFGDGSAAILLGGPEASDASPGYPHLVDYDSHFFENSLDYMGYENNENGMKIMLSPKIPAEIKRTGRNLLTKFMANQSSELSDIDHWIAHPGGQAILDAFRHAFDLPEGTLDASQRVLAEYGNLSSATVLYVLKATLEKTPDEGDLGVLTAFGPGFNADLALLEW